MRTDRELLELAAKAAGITYEWDGWADAPMVLTEDGNDTRTWNPLTDDGDALQLAVRLRLDLSFIDNLVEVCWHDGNTGYTRYKNERISDAQGECEATRRAIVRAAAEIGAQGHPDNKDGGAVYG